MMVSFRLKSNDFDLKYMLIFLELTESVVDPIHPLVFLLNFYPVGYWAKIPLVVFPGTEICEFCELVLMFEWDRIL